MSSIEDISIAQVSLISFYLICLQSFALLVYLVVKRKVTKDRFLRFFGVLAIGLSCALFPWGPLGIMMGSPAMILMAILVTMFMDKNK